MIRLIWIAIALLWLGCENNEPIAGEPPEPLKFDVPQRVQVAGFDDHIMEPFFSRDGMTLWFNNLNNPAVNTNLHFATRIDDLNFQYEGELQGVNTPSLEGVATMDRDNQFYFVSTRSYNQDFSTIYRGTYQSGGLSDVQLVDGISLNQPGWVNFDVEVSADGNQLYFVDGRYDENGGPYESDLILATKSGTTFKRATDQSLLSLVNTDALEYAAAISSDGLELSFTRVDAPLTSQSVARIYVSTRASVLDSFGEPFLIEEITGFVEGLTISPDGQILYYHKRENNRFFLYMTRKQ